ncbi:hypothetical protein ACF3OC_10965 [Sphingobacterium cellulitidis]|uniref:LIC11966 family surface protein n=1 Tax=Sphingobacterium cellulitidis TaxID=1768011 RepID=UPI00370D44DC
MIRKSLTCLAMVGTLILGSCGSSQKNAAEYNNAIITVINGNEAHISNMNAAMTSADYTKAETVRSEWEKSLSTDIKKVEDLGDFNGDGDFQNAVVAGLKEYQKIVTDSYPKLIEIRKNNVQDPATESKLLDEINNAFESAANNVNKASDAFETKYNK